MASVGRHVECARGLGLASRQTHEPGSLSCSSNCLPKFECRRAHQVPCQFTNMLVILHVNISRGRSADPGRTEPMSTNSSFDQSLPTFSIAGLDSSGTLEFRLHARVELAVYKR